MPSLLAGVRQLCLLAKLRLKLSYLNDFDDVKCGAVGRFTAYSATEHGDQVLKNLTVGV